MAKVSVPLNLSKPKMPVNYTWTTKLISDNWPTMKLFQMNAQFKIKYCRFFENTCTLVFTVFKVQDFVNFAKFKQQWNVKRCFKSCRLKTVDMNSKPLWSQPIENKFKVFN